MKLPFSGGCQCGAVRYECSDEPMMMGLYHCREYQRSSGSAYVPWLALPKAA